MGYNVLVVILNTNFDLPNEEIIINTFSCRSGQIVVLLPTTLTIFSRLFDYDFLIGEKSVYD